MTNLHPDYKIYNLYAMKIHLLWKLKDLMANAKITANSRQNPTTMTPAMPVKSCLNPKTFLSKTFVDSI